MREGKGREKRRKSVRKDKGNRTIDPFPHIFPMDEITDEREERIKSLVKTKQKENKQNDL